MGQGRLFLGRLGVLWPLIASGASVGGLSDVPTWGAFRRAEPSQTTPTRAQWSRERWQGVTQGGQGVKPSSAVRWSPFNTHDTKDGTLGPVSANPQGSALRIRGGGTDFSQGQARRMNGYGDPDSARGPTGAMSERLPQYPLYRQRSAPLLAPSRPGFRPRAGSQLRDGKRDAAVKEGGTQGVVQVQGMADSGGGRMGSDRFVPPPPTSATHLGETHASIQGWRFPFPRGAGSEREKALGGFATDRVRAADGIAGGGGASDGVGEAGHGSADRLPSPPQKPLSAPASPRAQTPRNGASGSLHDANMPQFRLDEKIPQLKVGIEAERWRIWERQEQVEAELAREQASLRVREEQLLHASERWSAGEAQGTGVDGEGGIGEEEVRERERIIDLHMRHQVGGLDRWVDAGMDVQGGTGDAAMQGEQPMSVVEMRELIHELREERRRGLAKVEEMRAKWLDQRQHGKQLADQVLLLHSVRRKQDEAAADMLMQVAASTRHLTLVQKDLVLLRAAWQDLEETSPAAVFGSTHAEEVRRLLEKLQDDVARWQLRLDMAGTAQALDDETQVQGQRSRDLLAEAAYRIDEDEEELEADNAEVKNQWARSVVERERRLGAMQESVRQEAACVRRAAAGLASRSALVSAERQRMLALTAQVETLKAQREMRQSPAGKGGSSTGAGAVQKPKRQGSVSELLNSQGGAKGWGWGGWTSGGGGLRGAPQARGDQAAGVSQGNGEGEGEGGGVGGLAKEERDRVQNAAVLKAEGNALHAAEEFERAFECYARAQEAVGNCTSDVAAHAWRSCALNSASCLLRLRRYPAAVLMCENVLNRDPANVKALYRRALASRQLSRQAAERGEAHESERLLLDALADVSRAQAFEPADAAIHAASGEIRAELQERVRQRHGTPSLEHSVNLNVACSHGTPSLSPQAGRKSEAARAGGGGVGRYREGDEEKGENGHVIV